MTSPKSGSFAAIRPLVLGLSVAVLAVVAFLAVRHMIAPHDSAKAELGRVTGTAAIGGPFELSDHTGKVATDADFRGRYMLIYFGYTYCPDVCPTSLSRNMEALDALGETAEKVTPILISVDPERDTPAQLADYVDFFDSRLVGLTGSAEQVAKAAQAYRVYYAKAAGETEDPETYLVDHSSFTYLMGPDGQFVDFYRHNITPEDMATRLRSHLG